jgi:hypothetical protein
MCASTTAEQARLTITSSAPARQEGAERYPSSADQFDGNVNETEEAAARRLLRAG